MNAAELSEYWFPPKNWFLYKNILNSISASHLTSAIVLVQSVGLRQNTVSVDGQKSVEARMPEPERSGVFGITGHFCCHSSGLRGSRKRHGQQQKGGHKGEDGVTAKREEGSTPDETLIKKGSGCGSVGRAVASNTRGLRFESSHWETLISDISFVYCQMYWKDEIKKKRPGMAHFYKSSDLYLMVAVVVERQKTAYMIVILTCSYWLVC